MNSYQFSYDVHIFDTDCYGVVWHGSYAKWLEMGRVDFCKKVLSMDLKILSDEHQVVVPVVEQTVRYKAMARFGDNLTLTTRLEPHEPKLIFHQHIEDSQTGKRMIEARTDCVLTHPEGRLYRRFPEIMKQKLGLVL